MKSAINRWKEVILLVGLVTFVLAVNQAVIAWDMMYIEQPIIYKANQGIHSLKDLLNIYFHPALLDLAIPFFRPSGHFLIYQLLIPVVGWHNTKALLIVNLLFLALSGYLIIKLYELLFPGYKAGGFIAFALYLMQPALIISRFTLLHFEFAYIFFSLLSCYCFLLFCEKNRLAMRPNFLKKFNYLYLFLLALIFYFIAVTFKEPALLLGPALGTYFIIFFYGQGQLKNLNALKIIAILACVSLASLFYIALSWPTPSNLIRGSASLTDILNSAKELFLFLICAQNNVEVHGLFNPALVWRHPVAPYLTRAIVWTLLALTLASLIKFMLSPWEDNSYKKSLLFLLLSCALFLVLPICWGAGFPWHTSLSLIFLGLIIGFATDYFFQSVCKNTRRAYVFGLMLALAIGFSTLSVNQENINFISRAHENHYFVLDRNAVFHPPAIKNKLNSDSLIVIEDSANFGPHNLGNSEYPLTLAIYSPNRIISMVKTFEEQKWLYVKRKTVANATLFSWAYLLPDLKEDVYAFQIQHMSKLPDPIIYSWLQHLDNIFCLGYDANFQWHDRSEIFKNNLLLEQARRHLAVNHYSPLNKVALNGRLVKKFQLAFPDPESCEYFCDQKNNCKGFTYISEKTGLQPTSQCHFYEALGNANKPCKNCTAFIKA